MKLTVQHHSGLKFIANSPDAPLKEYWQDTLHMALQEEFNRFIDEVDKTLDALKPGEAATLKSKPVEITLSRPVGDSEKD